MNTWSAIMLISAGLFAGTVFAFAWDRGPAWRSMPAGPFLRDFGHTINRADKIQPALLVVAIASAAGFAWSASSSARLLAVAAALGFTLVLVLSVAIQVPLQRSILRLPASRGDAVARMRSRWLTNHVGRSVVSAASFALAVAAVSV